MWIRKRVAFGRLENAEIFVGWNPLPPSYRLLRVCLTSSNPSISAGTDAQSSACINIDWLRLHVKTLRRVLSISLLKLQPHLFGGAFRSVYASCPSLIIAPSGVVVDTTILLGSRNNLRCELDDRKKNLTIPSSELSCHDGQSGYPCLGFSQQNSRLLPSLLVEDGDIQGHGQKF